MKNILIYIKRYIKDMVIDLRVKKYAYNKFEELRIPIE